MADTVEQKNFPTRIGGIFVASTFIHNSFHYFPISFFVLLEDQLNQHVSDNSLLPFINFVTFFAGSIESHLIDIRIVLFFVIFKNSILFI